MLLAVPILLVLAYLYPYIPGHDVSLCAVKLMTGIGCPGCGVIRAVSALLHFNFLESFRFNPAGFLVFFWLLLIWLKKATGKELGLKIFSYVLIGCLFAVWLLKLSGFLTC
jgi:hypothetical protein